MSPQDKAREIDAGLDAKARKDADEKAEEKKTAERKMDAEHNGEVLNKILSCLDSLSSRMDAYGARLDGAEAAAVDRRKKKDAEEEKGESAKLPFRKDGEIETHRGGEPSGIKEKGDPKELAADARSDSLYGSPRTISDSQRDEVSEIQTDAERVAGAWGRSANKPMTNELPFEYRRRMASAFKSHSKEWADVDLRGLSPDAIKVATKQIFADAYAAATDNVSFIGTDQLRCIRRVNRDTGHTIKEYYGQPMAWMQQFTGGRRLAKFNLGKIRNDR